MTAPACNGTKIGYLVKTFPKVSETFILNEILALQRQGLTLEIFSLYPPAETESHRRVSRIGNHIHYLPSTVFDWRLHKAHAKLLAYKPGHYMQTLRFLLGRDEGASFSAILQAAYLASILPKSGVTHIHAHFASEPTGIAELVHYLTGIPFSFTAHAKDIYLLSGGVLGRKIRHAKFVITCSEYNRSFLQGLSTNGTAIYRVYHGLDAEQFQPSFPSDVCTEQTPTVLSVGRLREKKGFGTLVEACRLLRGGGYKFRCYIVGYGPLQPTLERLIHDFRLEDTVSLLGKKSQDEILPLYRQATIFVLPCQIAADGDRDGIPNVLLEAMAMQIPVISTDVSGIPELIEHMKDGMIVPPKNPGSLAKAMGHLLDQPALRYTLGEAARKKVLEHFPQALHIRKLYELFTTGDST